MNDIKNDFALKKCFIWLRIPDDFVNLRFSNETQKYEIGVCFGSKIELILAPGKMVVGCKNQVIWFNSKLKMYVQKISVLGFPKMEKLENCSKRIEFFQK